MKVRVVKLQTLKGELENMKMKETEILNNFYTKLIELVNQMKTYGEEISDQRIIEKIYPRKA